MEKPEIDAEFEYFEGHPLPWLEFCADFRFIRMNAKAADIIPNGRSISAGSSPDEVLQAMAEAFRGELWGQGTGPVRRAIFQEAPYKVASTDVQRAMAEGAWRMPSVILPDRTIITPFSHPLPSGRHQWVLIQDFAVNALRDVVSSISDGFALFAVDGGLTTCNDAFTEFLFRDRMRSAPFGERFTDLLTTAFVDSRLTIASDSPALAGIEDAIRALNCPPSRIDFRTPDNHILAVETSPSEDGALLCRVRDVTPEKAADLRALTLLQDAAESLEEGFALWDEDMRFVMCNQKYLRTVLPYRDRPFDVGTSARDAMAEHYHSGLAHVPENITADEFADQTVEWVRSYGEPQEFSFKTGRTVIVRTNRTDLGGYLLTALDVTNERNAEAELEAQRDITHQNEKLSALGELLAGVAHELNNPLSIVVGYSQMLQGTLATDDQNQKIDRISQAAERSARIIKTFLAMARQKPSELQSSSLVEVIEVAIDVAGYGLRSSGVEIEFEHDGRVPPALIDKDQLAQVFSNLIVNAEQAIAGTQRPARLKITCSHDATAREIVTHVMDNGVGIPNEIISRVFDPFFTTKEVGKGTGFGLAFCHRIVTNHNGTLTVTSSVGHGSTFTVRVPVASAIEPDTDTFDEQHPSGLARRVLVLDDEPMVAELIAEILESEGYKARCVNCPVEAIAIARKTAFDAIISDMRMPRMTGEQFMQNLVSLSPQYSGRIGFATGDALTEEVNRFLGSGRVSYIKKPILADELKALAATLCQSQRTS